MKKIALLLLFITFGLLLSSCSQSNEYHVALTGDDTNPGTLQDPLKTIQAAANLAQPGDIITVHKGVYRERIDPPRGGESDSKRIVYQAAPGEKVEIKGSEVVKGWKKTKDGIWRVSLPNSFFKNYNPYTDLIWGDWFDDKDRPHHTGEVFLNGNYLFEMEELAKVIDPKPVKLTDDKDASLYTWYTEQKDDSTIIWANFHAYDPNKELVEINAREACFYPRVTGINYITISGFTMRHAATQWAAPTAEQIGLIGTNWSKGWIIENNIISDSRCSGITLGKDRETGHNVWLKNPSKDGAIHYNEVILRCLENGWSKENIGSHIVRNNIIYNCEEAGICGSMGCAFSEVYNNHIYNVWVKRQFRGAEIGGIKFHGAVNTIIRNNRIHNSKRGLWLDWMTQGTRVSSNLMYDNQEDFFTEVNHGPYLVDNNIFLSGMGIRDHSQGGAFVHNLITGVITTRPQTRYTPQLVQQSTEVAGLYQTKCGDNRYYNNIFVGGIDELTNQNSDIVRTGYGLDIYGDLGFKTFADNNVFYNTAKPLKDESPALVNNDKNPNISIKEKDGHIYLSFDMDELNQDFDTQMITSQLLGKTKIGDLPFENTEGKPFVIDLDYWGNMRDVEHPTPGPFEKLSENRIRVW